LLYQESGGISLIKLQLNALALLSRVFMVVVRIEIGDGYSVSVMAMKEKGDLRKVLFSWRKRVVAGNPNDGCEVLDRKG